MKIWLAVSLIAVSCAPQSSGDFDGELLPPPASSTGPQVPEIPEGPLDPSIENELDGLIASIMAQGFDSEALGASVAGGDVRIAWFVVDLMRFFQSGSTKAQLDRAFLELTGQSPDPDARTSFVPAGNLLIGWDLPAWDGYDRLKKDLYTILEPKWLPFFEENVSIDWRLVTWGGVLIDDRELGDKGDCVSGCIAALDDPPTVPGSEGTWYADSDVVFGLVVGDDALALPKNQMEVHEMVNLTLGGRRLGVPYCTLCGSTQAYFTDSVPEPFQEVVLRTSGLLSRSNKVMYDLGTKSVLDTFTGEARSGPLGHEGVVLEQTTVVASTWGQWKRAHPETRIIVEDGGIGRSYDREPLGDRDANGPIFPVGPVDPRLSAHENVVGVIGPDGVPVAFPVAEARAALMDGRSVGYEDLVVTLDGDGLQVEGPGGRVVSHQAFWFAWSQFHPNTLLWVSGE